MKAIPIRNVLVADAGREYRIASQGARVLLVALCSARAGGKERFLDLDKSRAKQLIKKARELRSAP